MLSNSQTLCPKCEQDTGFVGTMRVDGVLKIRIYLCRMCQHRWQTSERWMDDWQVASNRALTFRGEKD